MNAHHLTTTCATLASIIAVQSAHAGVVVNIREIGTNVLVTGNGTLDLSSPDWGNPFRSTDQAVLAPQWELVVGGAEHSDSVDLYSRVDGWDGPSAIGSLGVFTSDLSAGDILGLDWSNSFALGLTVPGDYISGQFLSGSSLYEDHTIQSLGLTPGAYTWTWTTDSGSDFFTINVIPAPGAAALAFAACCAATTRRRNR